MPKPHESLEYVTRSGTLTVGALFRVAGDRTVFRFRRYVELGAWKWVEATADRDGYFRAFYVGRKPRTTKTGLRLVPYKVRPCKRRMKGKEVIS